MDAISLHVALLAAFLGAPSFDRRENATIALHATPPHIAVLLTCHTDPEITCRAIRVSREQRRDWAYGMVQRMHAKQFDRLPWIDGLHRAGDFGQTVRNYLELARQDPPPAGWTQWMEYRVATRLWLRDCLTDGVPVCELQRLLDAAGEVELAWLAANKRNKQWWPPEVPEED